jgi:ABC-type transport system involved in cytochrome c biogenesis ATPase subunit
MAYLFATGEGASQLVDRLQEGGWRGQIIGPHGIGKSTLLATLIEPLKERGRQPVQIALHDGQRTLGVELSQYISGKQAIVVIVDGYEQLSWWSRLKLKHLCSRHNWGLLVTAHANVGLPTICEVQSDQATVQQLARDLQRSVECLVSDADVAAEFQRQGGNVRETLFGLYDLYGLRQIDRHGKVRGAS